MPTIPKSEIPEGGERPNGWVYARVSKCETRLTKAGDPSYNITLEQDADGSFLGYDTIMLAGGGLGLGVRKMDGLGVLQDLGDEVSYPDPPQMVGARAWSYWSDETWNGKTYARVNIQHGKGGYSQEEPSEDHPEAPPMRYGGAPGTSDPTDAPPHDDSDFPF